MKARRRNNKLTAEYLVPGIKEVIFNESNEIKIDK